MSSPTRPDDSPIDVFGAVLPEQPEDPGIPPRRRRGGAIIGGALAVVLVVAGGAYSATAASAELPAATALVAQTPGATTDAPVLAWPAYGSGAIGAVGFDDAEQDGVLARYGSDDPVPTGSIAKVVTALVILAERPIPDGSDGADITFTAADVGYYAESLAENGSVAPVSAGLELTQREALTVLMLPSANNYSKSLAIWAFGSEEAYLAAARAWLDEQGLTRTVVTDTSGLSPDTVSTTSDMVRLGELLVADPVLAPIVALPRADVPGVGVVQNTNTLLGRGGVDGIKTGTTDEAGSCLLFSVDTVVEGEPVTLVGVVVGARTHPQLASDILTLLPSVEAGFRTVPLTTEGQDFGSYTSLWGDSVVAETPEARSVLTWGAVTTSTTVELDPLGTVADGADVGTATVSVNGTPYELPLVADGSIGDPGFGWRVSHPAELLG
ncbi:D-alanyl-D-alanine carboxypeptidase family protein [Rathayibacter sp. VKM Ac-2630]|uniref:D-alanyl-D-alanine carboxypeptidase family protein n=1 Tax=Rathayibacter sp. VKM Ac-2630 TaxID=1938617 RepID=UPI0011158170|nr:D-alanyl-D-alanine carboxypeptidase [Rathayibacter sp. VKM Ac-2630]